MWIVIIAGAIFIAVIAALWGYKNAMTCVVQDIRRQSYFVHDGRVYECVTSYIGNQLAEIEALRPIPAHAHPLTATIELPIDPSTLNKVKSLSEAFKDQVQKETYADKAKEAPLKIFNFPPPNYHYCCLDCLDKEGYMRNRMILCPVCGNKRCPKAENHKYKCTGSNAVDQKGELEIFYVGTTEGNCLCDACKKTEK